MSKTNDNAALNTPVEQPVRFLTKEQKFSFWPLAVASLAFIFYLITLSSTVFPGPSAVLTTFAAGLWPATLAAHPIWSTIVCWLVHLPILTLPVRLNLFDAICAALSVGLFGQLVSRLVFSAAYEASDVISSPLVSVNDVRAMRPLVVIEAHEAIMVYNQRVATLAAISGCAAAATLAFSVPFWSTATRLGLQSFDLLLVLLTIHAAGRHRISPRLNAALTTAFLCGIGCIESPIFVPLTPLLFFFLVSNRVRIKKSWEYQTLLVMFTVVLGAMLNLALLVYVRSTADLVTPLTWHSVVISLIREHYLMLMHALPHTDWIWILLFAFAPALAALLASPRSLREPATLSSYLMHAAFTGATLTCLLNTPLSPWILLRETGNLPVMHYVGVALAAGYLLAYWLMLATSQSKQAAAVALVQPKGKQTRTVQNRSGTNKLATFSKLPYFRFILRAFGYSVSAMLLITICLLPILNWSESDGRAGAFMDNYAQLVLDTMGSRTWLATDGLLDNHLRLQALATHKPLHLICLQMENDPIAMRNLQDAIDQEPCFASMRIRLKNAAMLGASSFLQEWLSMDPQAPDRVAVFEFADFWTEAGFTPKPNLVLFTGAHKLRPEEVHDLIAAHMRFWDQMEPVLKNNANSYPGLASEYRRSLRRHIGFIGNQLGVLLQDMGLAQEAFAVYTRVAHLDPENVSVRINRYAMTLEGVCLDQKTAAAKAAREAINKIDGALNMDLLTRLYGVVRSPQAIAGAGLTWLYRGLPGQAELALRRAIASASPTNRLDYLDVLANLLILQDKEDQGETALQEMLRSNPRDPQAMLGMMRIELLRNKPEAAKMWWNQLPEPFAQTPDAILQKATIQLAMKQVDQARKTLVDALEKDPKLVPCWLLLVAVFIADDKVNEAELLVLPRMQQIVQQVPGTEYLLYAASGFLAQAKDPAKLREARESFANASALHPESMDFLEKAMLLDLQSRDLADAEQHARRALRADRKNALGNYVLGEVLLERGDLESAKDFLQRSLEAKTTVPALNDYAECLHRMGKLQDAEWTARQAIVIDAHCAPAWNTLAATLLDAQRPAEAEEAVKQAMSLVTSNAYVQTTYIRCLAAQGHTQEARTQMDRLLQHKSDIPSSLREKVKALSDTLGTH